MKRTLLLILFSVLFLSISESWGQSYCLNIQGYCEGVINLANGERYVGEWKDEKFHGQGTYTWPNGDKYVGEWKDDKKHGYGTLYIKASGRKMIRGVLRPVRKIFDHKTCITVAKL